MEKIGKIAIHFWFDKEGGEAAAFYQQVFPDCRILGRRVLPDTPSGETEVITLQIADSTLQLLSAGPYFQVNPSLSLMISCSSEEEARGYWTALGAGGKVLMPFTSYDFSALYGWVEDAFGVSWQIMYVGDAPIGAKIRPALMFVGDNCGHAQEAMTYYTTLFAGAGGEVAQETSIIMRSYYGEGFSPNTPEMINFAEFVLAGQHFSVMDSAYPHDFGFTEGVSLMVNCRAQGEIDYFWAALSAVPEAEQCGWLRDRYGLAWQIVPLRMHEMMRDGNEAAVARVTAAFLQMKKFDLAALEEAYRG